MIGYNQKNKKRYFRGERINMAKKQIAITLENEQGEKVTYKAGKIMARVTRSAMKMYSEFEKVDEKGNPELSEIEQIDMMLELIADDIFSRVPEVTVDSILDGVEADKLSEVLQDVIMRAMGIEPEDVAEAEEGK